MAITKAWACSSLSSTTCFREAQTSRLECQNPEQICLQAQRELLGRVELIKEEQAQCKTGEEKGGGQLEEGINQALFT